MSTLGYKLKRILREADEMTGKVPQEHLVVRGLRCVLYIVQELWYNHPYIWWNRMTYIWKNLKFFWPHIIKMRDFDSSYQLELFCDSLEYLARGLKSYNNCAGSERNYRRCLFAAKQLRKAYNYKGYMDKSYQALSTANPIRFEKLESGCSLLVHDYKTTEEYYDKMWTVIHKRIDKTEAEAKKDAWAYINKHLNSWWD